MEEFFDDNLILKWINREFNRLKRERGFTQTDLGEALGISQPQAARLLRGLRGIKANEVEVLEELFDSTRTKVESSAVPGVPLVSWVSAGAMVKDEYYQEDFDDYPLSYAPDLDPNGDWIALRVDGRSMDKISPHDSIIFVNRKEKNLVPNACYVIIDNNGDASYKRYSPPNKFEPVSTKPQNYNSIIFESGQEPLIVGRVRKSILSM